MARAQGSLEYLIIISIAVAIIAIVSMIMVNSFGQRQSDYVMASCASAASTCRSTLIADPTASCDFCDTSCKYSNGTEVFPTAATCCKSGQNSLIYGGSLGCVPSCSDGTPYNTCTLDRPTYCNDQGDLVPGCGSPGYCGCPSGTPVCKSDGTCYNDCPPTDYGCIPDNKPLFCNYGALAYRCQPTQCGCPADYSSRSCGRNQLCTCAYHYDCLGTGACKETVTCNCVPASCGAIPK